MSSNMHGSRLLELRSLGRAIKPAGGEVNAEVNPKERAVRSESQDTHSSAGLTLDDFGGRSDALGG